MVCRAVVLTKGRVASVTSTQARNRLRVSHPLSGTRFPKQERPSGGLHQRPGLGLARSERPLPKLRALAPPLSWTALHSGFPVRQETPIGSGPVPRGLSSDGELRLAVALGASGVENSFRRPEPAFGWEVIPLSPP